MARSGLQLIGALGALSFMTGCAGLSESPETPTPLEPALLAEASSPWWQQLGDTSLNARVQSARSNGFDVMTAYAQLQETRGQVRRERAGFMPEIALAGETRASRGPDRVSDPSSDTVQIEFGWRADLFGQLRASVAALEETAEARRELVIDAQRLAAIETVAAWLELSALEQDIVFARDSERRLADSLNKIERLSARGYATQTDVMRAHTQWFEVRSDLQRLAIQRATLTGRLRLLSGPIMDPLQPRRLDDMIAQLSLETVDSDRLVEARPDVRAAWRSLSAAVSNARSARRALRPSLDLTAQAAATSSRGFSVDPSDLVSQTAARLAMPLLGRGRLLADIDVADARVEQALIAYEQTALVALVELDDAAAAFQALTVAVEEDRRAETAARGVLEGARRLFDAGEVSYLDIVLAEEDFIRVQRTAVRSKRDLAIAWARYHAAAAGAGVGS